MPTKCSLKISWRANVGFATSFRIFSSSSDLNSRTSTRLRTFSKVFPNTWNRETETCQARVEQDSSQSLQRFETESIEKSKSDLPHYSSTCKSPFQSCWWLLSGVGCSGRCMVASRETGWTAKPCGLLLSSFRVTNKAVSFYSVVRICSYSLSLVPISRSWLTHPTHQLTFVGRETSGPWLLLTFREQADNHYGQHGEREDKQDQPPGWNHGQHPLTLIKQLQWFHSTGQPAEYSQWATLKHRKHLNQPASIQLYNFLPVSVSACSSRSSFLPWSTVFSFGLIW